MDLRRFLVFFVLVFFLFSINVFSASIFDVENITHLPHYAEDNDFIIGYNHLNKNVFIAVYVSSRSVEFFNIKEDGVYDENDNRLKMFYINLNPDTDEWGVAIGQEHSTWFNVQGLEPCAANKDVYRNGQICIFGKKYDGNLGVLGGLTSSVIFIGLLKPFLYLMPLILIFIILILMFFKMWRFLKGVF